MRRFQALLDPDTTSTPREEQERASRDLVGAVQRSHLQWWTKKVEIPTRGKAILIIVAPYSHYDLALLDALDAALARQQASKARLPVPVYVGNIQEYPTVEALSKDVPLIKQAPPQTPITALWVKGRLSKSAWGKDGRDLTADVLGLKPEELDACVFAKVASCAAEGPDSRGGHLRDRA